MKEAVLSLKIPTHWIFELASRYDAAVRILDRKPFEKDGVRDLVEISAAEDKLKELIENINELPTIRNIDLSIVEKDKAVGSVASKCFACRSLASSDCFLVTARSRTDGQIEWTLIFSTKEELSKLISTLEEYGIKAEVDKIIEYDEKKMLTARQEQIIQIAFEHGYFEFPRRVSVSELAGRLKISKSTLAEILRKGEEKIVTDYFRKKSL